MLNLFRFVLTITMVFSLLVGCNTVQTEKPIPPSQPQKWSGPAKDTVSSTDNPHCGKSKVAEKWGLPGYLLINEGDKSYVYHSTEKITPLHSDWIDSSYRLGDFSLWKNPSTTQEVYVGKSKENQKPSEVVVYELGGCE